jgi:hypothetical protein
MRKGKKSDLTSRKLVLSTDNHEVIDVHIAAEGMINAINANVGK